MLDLLSKPRRFLSADFKINDWSDIEPYGRLLLERDITDRAAFDDLLRDISELTVVCNEEGSWRFVRNSTHTNDMIAQQQYEQFITAIEPPLSELYNALNQKLLASAFIEQPQSPAQELMFKRLKMKAAMFRSANVLLESELQQIGTEYEKIMGAMTVELDGQTMTMPQAGNRLLWPEREKREEAWKAIQARRMQDKDAIDAIFDTMVKKRHQMALNAGYANYRDYMFDSLQRFDYTPADSFAFHEAIEKHVLPLRRTMLERRRKQMGVDILRPWDTGHDPLGRPALKAFDGAADLIAKGKAVLSAIDPLFGQVVEAQEEMGRLDLESRPHKRPGAYNAWMHDTYVPFMFANSTSNSGDIETFIHESGHAAHDILSYHLPLMAYREFPMEIAEVASMSMELFAFDKWNMIFPETDDCMRAQEEQLAGILSFFPWMAQVDAFQHAIYTQPDLTPDERHQVWEKLALRFNPGGIDYTGLDDERRTFWHRQGHVFTAPFYYIEYGIAQLGALQLWRNYMTDPQKTIAQYKDALSLGYTRSLPVLFSTAGIKFDFSSGMLGELVPFLAGQLEKFTTDQALS